MLNQPRSTQRRKPKTPNDEPRLLKLIIDLATKFGRYGYRRITELLRREGWSVNHKRVERLWRREGLKVPQKQPKKRRLWLNDGSCVRLRPERPRHVWAYDFVHHRTHDGRAFRLLVVVDEFTRECLAIDVARRLRSGDVLHRLAELFAGRGAPEYIHSDNGPEFTAEAVRDWLERLDVETLFIEPGSPWENGVELILPTTIRIRISHNRAAGSAYFSFRKRCSVSETLLLSGSSSRALSSSRIASSFRPAFQ